MGLTLTHERFSLPADLHQAAHVYVPEKCHALHFIVVGKDRRTHRLNHETLEHHELPAWPEHYDLDNLQFHSLDQYLSITEVSGQNGILLNWLEGSRLKALRRGEYQVKNCIFPIAFLYHHDEPHLLCGTDWNRLDLIRLHDGVKLTDRVVDHETKSHYLDYFHSGLHPSLEGSQFLSNGWVWGPMDMILHSSITDFLKKYEHALHRLDYDDTSGYNWDRPVCWIDEHTVGIGYNRQENDDEPPEGEPPSEILWVDTRSRTTVKRMEFDGFPIYTDGEVQGDLIYDQKDQIFIALSNRKGVYITDREGQVLLKDESLTGYQYDSEKQLFYKLEEGGNTISVQRIIRVSG